VIKSWDKEEQWIVLLKYSRRFKTIEEIIEDCGIRKESELLEVIERTYEV
jgi:hypothetical protein